MPSSPTTEEILAQPSPLDDHPTDEIWDRLDHGDHFDREGRRITLRQWTKLFRVREYQIVVQEHIGPYFVSTVWIGLDHSFGQGPPLIYETMVFKGEDRSDLEMDRYSTLGEAEEGHRKMVEKVRLFAELGE